MRQYHRTNYFKELCETDHLHKMKSLRRSTANSLVPGLPPYSFLKVPASHHILLKFPSITLPFPTISYFPTLLSPLFPSLLNLSSRPISWSNLILSLSSSVSHLMLSSNSLNLHLILSPKSSTYTLPQIH
jgi:hypothetical protein